MKRELQKEFVERLKKFEDFGAFTSELNHELARWKKDGEEVLFLRKLLDTQIIDDLMAVGQERKALYIVSLVSFVFGNKREAEPVEVKKYAGVKLKQLTYYDDVEHFTQIVKNNKMKERLLTQAIPEFLKRNIVETSVEQTR